jgi:16S rRNA (uracil1498-N3)-methyltransferase
MAPRVRVFASGGVQRPQDRVRDDAFALSPAASHHLARVLRLDVGARVVLFDGEGSEQDATLAAIHSAKRAVEVLVHLEGPPRAGLVRDASRPHVLQGLSKGDKLERVVRACAELGAAAVWPVHCERSVARPDAARAAAQRLHLEEVSVSASEQCGRADLCVVAPFDALSAALARASDEGLRGCFADELGGVPVTDWLRATTTAASDHAPPVAVLIGPEGGLTDDERAIASRRGFTGVSLGPRTLRTETAGPAFVAIASAVLGDLAAHDARRALASPTALERAIKRSPQ